MECIICGAAHRLIDSEECMEIYVAALQYATENMTDDDWQEAIGAVCDDIIARADDAGQVSEEDGSA